MEPDGTIRFKGVPDSIVWESQSFELWNGFTADVEGTRDEVFNAPESTSALLTIIGQVAIIGSRRARK